MYKNLSKYSAFLLKSNNLVKTNSEKTLVNYFNKLINMVIYNIVSLTCILTILLFNSNTVNLNSIQITKKYLSDMCKTNKSMKGGTVLPSEYFGVDSNRYTANAEPYGNTVNFEEGFARPALTSTMPAMPAMAGGNLGGCNHCGRTDKKTGGELGFNKQLLIVVSKIFKEHKVKIDKKLKQDLVNLIKMYVYLIVNKVKSKKNKKKELTVMMTKNILSKSSLRKLTI
jgi:hypothetical protein